LDWLLWGAAIAIQIATPLFGRVEQGFQLNPTHFAASRPDDPDRDR
jgi:hypothetical protein